jgi:hypothetical protein
MKEKKTYGILLGGLRERRVGSETDIFPLSILLLIGRRP